MTNKSVEQTAERTNNRADRQQQSINQSRPHPNNKAAIDLQYMPTGKRDRIRALTGPAITHHDLSP